MTPDRRAEVRREQLLSDVHISALHEAWLAGSAGYWERRARELEDARPKRGDFNGSATAAELAARYDRLTAAPAACRARARLVEPALLELADALDDLIAPHLEVEAQLRAALDAGDRAEIDRLAQLVDDADTADAA